MNRSAVAAAAVAVGRPGSQPTNVATALGSRAALAAALVPSLLYFLLSLADLRFSQLAFSSGVAEANPFLAYLLAHGQFVTAKMLLSVVVALLMVVVHAASRRWRWTVWSGVAFMGLVVGYHLWALPRVTGGTGGDVLTAAISVAYNEPSRSATPTTP